MNFSFAVYCLLFCLFFYIERFGAHRALHVLTHSCTTRRSSDLMRYPLHVGEFAGPLVRALWVAVALMPAAFVITGLWLYGNRRRFAWAREAVTAPVSRSRRAP